MKKQKADVKLGEVKSYNYSFSDKGLSVKKPVKPVEWKPENAKPYWIVDDYINVDRYHYYDASTTARDHITANNYFRTKALAQSAARQIKELLRNTRHA